MPPRQAVLPEELTERLSALEARVRGLTKFRGMGVVGVTLAAGIGCGVLVDYLWDVGTTIRLGLLAATVLIGLTAAWCALWRPLRRRPDAAELAALVERGHPELREQLLSAVELQSSDEPEAWKGSPLMREMLFRDTLAQTAEIDFTEAVSPVRAGCWATAGAVAWLGLLAPFAFSPSGYGLLLQRFVTPWQNLARAGNLYFEVEPGYRIVARGSDITIRATVGWRSKAGELPAVVWLNWTSAPGISDSHVEPIGDSRRMELDSTGTRYVTTIPHVFDGFDYDVSGGKARSPRFRIDVVDAPSLAAVKLDVQPPAYTGRPATTIDGVTGEIAVFEQSRLDFRLEFNKPVTEARLFLKSRAAGGELPFKLAGDHKSATLQLAAETGGPFEFHLTDEFGLTNPEEPERILVIIGDQPPRLVLSGSDDPQELRATDVLTVTATAEDDVGIGALELHYQINGDNEIDNKSRAGPAQSAAAGKLETPHGETRQPHSRIRVPMGIVASQIERRGRAKLPGPSGGRASRPRSAGGLVPAAGRQNQPSSSPSRQQRTGRATAGVAPDLGRNPF